MGRWGELNALSLEDLIRPHMERDTLFCYYDSYKLLELPTLSALPPWRNCRLVLCHHIRLNMSHAVCLPLLNLTHSANRGNKTFKPKKNIPEGSHQYELLKHAEATLGSGNLRMAVMLPDGEDLNEWVAVNSKHKFYQSLTLLTGI